MKWLLVLVPWVALAQPAEVPENWMDVLWALPVSHQAQESLNVALFEAAFGCDRFPQTVPGLWDRFACHANEWIRLRRETPEESYSWPARRELSLVEKSFRDFLILAKNE